MNPWDLIYTQKTIMRVYYEGCKDKQLNIRKCQNNISYEH